MKYAKRFKRDLHRKRSADLTNPISFILQSSRKEALPLWILRLEEIGFIPRYRPLLTLCATHATLP